MNYRVILTAQAKARIREQVRYIAVEAQSPVNAERWLDRVVEAVFSLETMPRRCAPAPENGQRPFEIRVMNIDGFLLLFTINDDDRAVRVLSARHSRQLPRSEHLPTPMPEEPSDD